MSVPEVSVVVPTHQRREAVLRALAAIARQTRPPDSYEVVVTVDGSTDGTGEALRRLETAFDLVLVEQEQRGRAAACNAAIRLARGPLLVILDDDMQPGPAWLEEHLRAHERADRVCVLGAVPIATAGATPVGRWVALKFAEHLDRLSHPEHVFVLRDFYTGNTSIARDVLFEAGLFDEEFDVYGNEDLELLVRLRGIGVGLRFSAEAAALQEYSKDFPAVAADTRAAGRTAVLLARKHPSVAQELLLHRHSSQTWKRARAALLWLTRRAPAFPAAVVALTTLLERLRFPRMRLYYSLALDYFFWVGVEDALPPRAPRHSLGAAQQQALP